MVQIVDGKALAKEVVQQLKTSAAVQEIAKNDKRIVVIAVDPTPETLSFIKRKEAIAQELGIGFEKQQFGRGIRLDAFLRVIENFANMPEVIGVLIQLPLPGHLDLRLVFNAVPFQKDIDVLSDAAFYNFFYNNSSKVIPPVTAAIQLICAQYGIELAKKFVVVLGAGKLIGMPSLAWFAKQGCIVCSFNSWTDVMPSLLRQADIIVAGIGRPEAVKGEHLKPGVVVFDVGYNIVNGRSVGDVDFDSAKQKASLITPVPGGIGPLTVAMVFHNTVELYKQYHRVNIEL